MPYVVCIGISRRIPYSHVIIKQQLLFVYIGKAFPVKMELPFVKTHNNQ